MFNKIKFIGIIGIYREIARECFLNKSNVFDDVDVNHSVD